MYASFLFSDTCDIKDKVPGDLVTNSAFLLSHDTCDMKDKLPGDLVTGSVILFSSDTCDNKKAEAAGVLVNKLHSITVECDGMTLSSSQ